MSPAIRKVMDAILRDLEARLSNIKRGWPVNYVHVERDLHLHKQKLFGWFAIVDFPLVAVAAGSQCLLTKTDIEDLTKDSTEVAELTKSPEDEISSLVINLGFKFTTTETAEAHAD